MDNADAVIKPLKDFGRSSIRLVKRCTKPDRKGELADGRELSFVWAKKIRLIASAMKFSACHSLFAPMAVPGLSIVCSRRWLVC
jgi:hypothetical protein